MPAPSIVVEALWNFAPTIDVTGVWPPVQLAILDLSSYVISMSSRRGRQTELNRYEAGSAEVVLDNRDGRFDPRNLSSPYYPYVKPMVWIRIFILYDGTYYPVIVGHARAWNLSRNSWGEHVATLSIADTLRLCSLQNFSGDYPSETSILRFQRVFDDLGWSFVTAVTGSPYETMSAETIRKTPVLDHLRNIDATENGLIVVEHDGDIVYYSRTTTTSRTQFFNSQCTFGDDTAAGEIPFETLSSSYDDDSVRNNITVRYGNAEEVSTDADSITAYLQRDLDIDARSATAGAAAAISSFYLSRFKDPIFRLKALSIYPGAGGDNWATILTLDLHHKVTVIDRPSYGGRYEGNYHIEQIDWDWQAEGVPMVTFGLIPTYFDILWKLGTSTLDTDTILGL